MINPPASVRTVHSRCHDLLFHAGRLLILGLFSFSPGGCRQQPPPQPQLNWYVFDERSGAFEEAARRCSKSSRGAYRVILRPLPTDADQQREQLARRLAAGDAAIDLIGMDVIWTAEFAAAGWIAPWPEAWAETISRGRLPVALASARYRQRLWAIPFTSNAQLLWYRSDRVEKPPQTWDELIALAERSGQAGAFQLQGQRYEGLTVFFVSLLASAGSSVLAADGSVALAPEPTRRTLGLLQRLASSPAADPALSTAREDDARLAFEAGRPSFMVNYSFVWPSAWRNAPAVAAHMAWAPWPAVDPEHPARVAVGGINLGVSRFSRHRSQAFAAARCLASAANQRLAARRGGLPPTLEALYDDPAVRETFPFADTLLNTLKHATQRPQSPLYSDLSLAISRSLHPLDRIDPTRDTARLHQAIKRALRSEGLL